MAGSTKIFTTIGASNHVKDPRQKDDFYATDPRCASELLLAEPAISHIWECACGAGHLAKQFAEQGKLAKATDLFDRGYGESDVDFFSCTTPWDGWIVTNPPYKQAQAFVEKALQLSPNAAMFLKLTFLEGQKRHKFFLEHPPSRVHVYSSRRKCGKDGNFDGGSSAIAYAWFVWEDGMNRPPQIFWIR